MKRATIWMLPAVMVLALCVVFAGAPRAEAGYDDWALSCVDTVSWIVENQIGADCFKDNSKKPLLNKLDVIIKEIEAGKFSQAHQKLVKDVLPKFDGDPTPPDWLDGTGCCGFLKWFVFCLLKQAVYYLSMLL